MRALMKVCLAGLLALSCVPEERRTLSPEVNISASDGLQTLPWVPGGKFTVKVSVPKPENGQLCGPLNARADITTPTLDTGAAVTSTFALKQEGNCGAYAGLTELAWPAGGNFQARVSVVGEEQVFDLHMDEPKVELVRGNQTRKGGQLTVPLCIVSSAARGAVNLTVEGGTLEDGQTARRINLGTIPCDDQGVLESPRKSWASAVLFTMAERAIIRADLEGRANDVLPVELLPDLESLELDLTFQPSTLPPPGSVFAVTVTATVAGGIADGVPVRIETTPEAEILPVNGVTDEQGTFTAYITVPEGIVSMRIDATSGALRRGKTLAASP